MVGRHSNLAARADGVAHVQYAATGDQHLVTGLQHNPSVFQGRAGGLQAAAVLDHAAGQRRGRLGGQNDETARGLDASATRQGAGGEIVVWSDIHKPASATATMWKLVSVKVRNERLIGEWTKVIEVNAARTAAAWKVGDPEHQKQFEQEMAVSSARATEIQNAIGKSELNAEEQSLYQEVLSTRKAYTEVRKNVFKAKNAGDLELGKRLYEGDMAAKRDIYLASLKKLELLEAKLLDEAAAQIRARYENGRLLLISLGVVAILLGIACAYWITRSITRPITRAVEVAQAVSAGDLTSHIVVESRDETGQLMHT